jgi:hypothetical protein
LPILKESNSVILFQALKEGGEIMTWFNSIMRATAGFIALSVLILVGGVLVPVGVRAEGGIAISGSFSQQDFQIPQGSSVNGSSIDVVVFNNSSDRLKVKMTGQAPVGVNVGLSQMEMAMAPGTQQQVLVSVEVTKDAGPGQYEVSVAAESYKEGMSGIQLAGAAKQSAKLTVSGESASVTVQAVSPEGKPLVASIRLNRVMAGQSREVAYCDNGTLAATVAPGNFVSSCYIGGREVAQQSFTLAANDKKQVTLSAATVFFEGFGIVPGTQQVSGKLASVKIVYTLKNLYQRVDKGEVILQVSRDGSPLEPLSLATLNPLEMGSLELNYNFIPAAGWTDGNYDFKLQLNLDSKPYANSSVEHLRVNGSGAASGEKNPPASDGGSAGGGGRGMNLSLIGGIAAGVIVVIGIIWLPKWRRKSA